MAFVGEIRAISPGGGEALFSLTVSGPTPGTAKVPPAAATPKQQLRATRAKLGIAPLERSTDLGDPEAILLRPPPEGSTVDAPPPETVLGILTAGSDTATVAVSGAPGSAEDGVTKLPIKVDGLGRGATYSGTLTLTGQDKAAADGAPTVELEVVVQDDIVWAIVAILGGLLLAAGSAALLRRWMPLGYLRRDLAATDRALIQGAVVFRRDFGDDFPDYSGPSEDDVGEWRDGVEAARDELKKSTFLIDMEDDDWKALRKRIEDGKADARALLGDGERPLGRSLSDLKKERTDLTKFLEENFSAERPPALVEAIDLLLHGMPLKVGDATRIAKEADASIALIERWQGLAEQYIGLQRWADVIVDDPSWSEDVELRVNELRKRLDDIGAALLDVVKSEGDITAEEISLNLTRSLRDLGVLRRKGIAKPPSKVENLSDEAVVIELSREVMAQPGLRARWVQAAEEEQIPAERYEELSSEAKAIALRERIQEKKWDEISAASSRILEFAILGVALTLAILAGLQQLYFDKPFGTLQDYLGLILLGTASAIVTPILTNATKSLAAAGSELPFLRRKSG